MRKILSIAVIALTLGGCNKDKDPISTIETESYATITFTTSQYQSIQIGDALPVVTATAYDSTIQESYPVDIVGSEAVDNSTPGLYVITAKTTNRFGYITEEAVFIAVTEVSDDVNLEGPYLRSNGEPVNITKLARGLYITDDVGGAPSLEVPAVFAQLNDTTIDLPLQPTEAGPLDAHDESLTLAPGDTTISYSIENNNFGTAIRFFTKQ